MCRRCLVVVDLGRHAVRFGESGEKTIYLDDRDYRIVAQTIVKEYGDSPWSFGKWTMNVDLVDVLEEARRSGKLIRVEDFMDFRVSQLVPMDKAPHTKKFEEAFPDIDWHMLEPASNKTGTLKTDKLKKMAGEKKPSEIEKNLLPYELLDMVYLQALISVATDGKGNPLLYDPMPYDDWPLINLNDTSAGYISNAPLDRGRVISKRSDFLSSISAVRILEHQAQPGLYFDKASPKREVTRGPGKDGKTDSKSVRYIMVSSGDEVMVCHVTGIAQMAKDDGVFNKATTMNIEGGFYEDFVYRVAQGAGPTPMECCSEVVEKRGLTKTDFKGWELNVGLLPKIVSIIVVLGRLSDGGATYRSVCAGAVASYLNPIVGLDKDLAMMMPDCVSSGKMRTLSGNGDNHMLVAMHTALTVMQGKDRKRILNGVFQGDDFACLKLDDQELYVDTLKAVWGMDAVPEGDGTPDFLQRYLCHRRQAAYMDTQRALIKIYWNPNTEGACHQAASLRFQCNAEEGSADHAAWEVVADILPIPEKVDVFALDHDSIITLDGQVIRDQGAVNLQNTLQELGKPMVDMAVGAAMNCSVKLARRQVDPDKGRMVALQAIEEDMPELLELS